MSLLSVIAAMAIGGSLMMIMGTTLASSTRRTRDVSKAADLRDLRLHLSTATNCANTRVKFPCGGSSGLVDSMGHTILSPGTTRKYGLYDIRATCSVGKRVIEFRFGVSGSWQALYGRKAPFACE